MPVLPGLSGAPRYLLTDRVRLPQRRSSQAERVQDHRDRTKRHRSARKHRPKKQARKGIENASGYWYTERFVDERKEEILPDIAHRGLTKPPCANDAPEIAFDQRHAGALHRDIGASSHGNPHVRLS